MAGARCSIKRKATAHGRSVLGFEQPYDVLHLLDVEGEARQDVPPEQRRNESKGPGLMGAKGRQGTGGVIYRGGCFELGGAASYQNEEGVY